MEITPHEIRVQVFALAVYRYAVRVGGTVTSWVRSPWRNVAVGGVPGSHHLSGLAADVVIDDVLTHPIAADGRHRLATGLGLKLVIEADHDHLQLLE